MFKSLPFGASSISCGSRSADVAQQRPINVDIVFRHPCGGKALFETLTHLFPIERNDARQRRDRLFHGFDDGAGDAVLDDLRHRAAAKSQDRRAAGHRLDHGEPERLRPVDREQQRLRVAQELRLLVVVDLADEFDAAAVEQRFDLGLEIGLVGAVHLGGDLERNAQRARDGDGAVGTFLRRDAAEKGEVAAARLPRVPRCRCAGMPWWTVAAKFAFGTGRRWAFEIETSGMSSKPR